MSSVNKTTSNTGKAIKSRTVGILGGTFDPIHNGHIEPALSVANTFNLDELRILPAHIPPHKGIPSASALHREAMVNLVCQNNDIFSLDTSELRSKKTSYTVNTLHTLKLASPSTTYFFIMGMDSLKTFTSWYLWEDILKYCHIIVNIRPGYANNEFNDATLLLLQKHQCLHINHLSDKDAGYIYIHEGIKKNISSTQIKQALKYNNNVPIDTSLVPKYIQDYVQKHKLYR